MVTVCDNKKSWKVLKPLLSHKIMSSEKITLFEETKNLKNYKETAKVSNSFLFTIIKNLKIPQRKPKLIAILYVVRTCPHPS